MFIFKNAIKARFFNIKKYHQDLRFTSEITDKYYPKRKKYIKKEITEDMISKSNLI
jgi:hypothetical protein